MLSEHSKSEYFTVNEDTAKTIDITFSIGEKSISNIARLYDDEVPCSWRSRSLFAVSTIRLRDYRSNSFYSDGVEHG